MIAASKQFENGPTFWKTSSANDDADQQVRLRTAESTNNFQSYFPTKVCMNDWEVVCSSIARARKNHQYWCFVQVSEVRIQFELTTESNYKGSYREKSIHFWKRLLSCGVIRLELSKASYNYRSKCATKSHQSYFLSIAKSRERNDHCKPLRPYPSQCHLVLVRMIFHAAALCLSRTQYIRDQTEEDRNSWNDR